MRGLTFAVSLLAAAGCKDKEKSSIPDEPPQQEPTPPSAAKAADAAPAATLEARIGYSGEAVPSLALTIDAVHEHEKPLEKAPWHAAGGDWTFLELRTPGGARFTAGIGNREAPEGAPFVLYEVMLIGSDRAQGGQVVTELAKGLGVKPPPRKNEKPLSPVHLTSIGLGENVARSPDGSFSGTGTWIASKWSFETDDDEAEIFFNYSITEKRAELSTKDEDYNQGIVRIFAAALGD